MITEKSRHGRKSRHQDKARRQLEKVSTNAKKLYARLCAGAYYMTDANDTPKAMEELIAVGLVGTIGRAVQFHRCYVPHGTHVLNRETIPEYPE